MLGNFLFFSTLLLSCSIVEKAKGIAYLRGYKSDSLEIEVPYITKGRGNIHSFDFSFKKWQDSSSDRIYISRFGKRITADSLIMVYSDNFLPQSNLKGEISFEDFNLIVSLRTPVYNNKGKIKRWNNFKFNGIYKLKLEK